MTENFLMARNFFRIFNENNPVMGYSKTFFIPEAKGLRAIPVKTQYFVFPTMNPVQGLLPETKFIISSTKPIHEEGSH